ncbi:MAG: P63C domain-containing protein [Chloroflexi bacterium]|nr:P63C domain-containing protein [Chloroflexota bacterium]
MSERAKGGIARAARLSPEERSIIASKAAAVRWSGDLLNAICGSPDQPVHIANVEIQCYVLEDGTRVLTQAGFLEALGRHRKANVRREGLEQRIPAILQGKAIRPFVTNEILEKSRPIAFRTPQPHGVRAYGYRADLLPIVCDIYLKARDADVLPPNQAHVAKQADSLMRGLAHVGIIALVDEATGYQELRAKDALSRILEAFIAKELQPWVKTFPDDFYKHLFRLRGLSYPEDPIKRPQYFGILTNDMIYKRLAPGVLNELKRVTPQNENGRPKYRYFRRLTSNVGYPKLREHLGSVVTLMKLSDEWKEFVEKLDRIHPRFNSQLPLLLQYDAKQDDGKGL